MARSVFRIVRRVDGQDVGALQQLAEPYWLNPGVGDLQLAVVWVVGDHAHAEGHGPAGRAPGHVAAPVESERLAEQAVAPAEDGPRLEPLAVAAMRPLRASSAAR
jgi:hypothetical protein